MACVEDQQAEEESKLIERSVNGIDKKYRVEAGTWTYDALLGVDPVLAL